MGSIAFAVANTGVPTTDEALLKTALEADGWTVAYVLAASGTAAPTTGYDVILASPSGIYSGTDGWASTPIGTVILGNEPGLRFAWGFLNDSTPQFISNGTFTLDTTHDVAGSLSSPLTSGTANHIYFSSSVINANVSKIGYIGGSYVLLAADNGDVLENSLTQGANRVWWGIDTTEWNSLSADGWQLLTNALNWVGGLTPSVTHDLAGTATSTTSTTASFGLAYSLVGSASSATSTTANLSVAQVYDLAASALAISETAGAISTSYDLAGSALSTSSAVGYVLAYQTVPQDDLMVVASAPTTGWAAMGPSTNPTRTLLPEPNPLTVPIDGITRGVLSVGDAYFEES